MMGQRPEGAVSGDCRVRRCRTTVGQSSFSVKGSHLWNTMPVDLKLQSELTVFSIKLKQWLKSLQQCEHWVRTSGLFGLVKFTVSFCMQVDLHFMFVAKLHMGPGMIICTTYTHTVFCIYVYLYSFCFLWWLCLFFIWLFWFYVKA